MKVEWNEFENVYKRLTEKLRGTEAFKLSDSAELFFGDFSKNKYAGHSVWIKIEGNETPITLSSFHSVILPNDDELEVYTDHEELSFPHYNKPLKAAGFYIDNHQVFDVLALGEKNIRDGYLNSELIEQLSL